MLTREMLLAPNFSRRNSARLRLQRGLVRRLGRIQNHHWVKAAFVGTKAPFFGRCCSSFLAVFRHIYAPEAVTIGARPPVHEIWPMRSKTQKHDLAMRVVLILLSRKPGGIMSAFRGSSDTLGMQEPIDRRDFVNSMMLAS